jgi:hypothetical protein
VLRFLLVEAGIKAIREDADLRKLYYRVLHRREQARAQVAGDRHLLIHAWASSRASKTWGQKKENLDVGRLLHRTPLS